METPLGYSSKGKATKFCFVNRAKGSCKPKIRKEIIAFGPGSPAGS